MSPGTQGDGGEGGGGDVGSGDWNELGEGGGDHTGTEAGTSEARAPGWGSRGWTQRVVQARMEWAWGFCEGSPSTSPFFVKPWLSFPPS